MANSYKGYRIQEDGSTTPIGGGGTSSSSWENIADKPEAFPPVVNLLDNSDFRNPVNQRGQTSYSGSADTIDRWRTWDSTAIVSINNGYLYHADALYQYPTNLDNNKTYTLAVKNTDDAIYTVTGKPVDCPYKDGLNIQLTTEDGPAYVRIWGEEQVKNLVWAALYEGSYTAETLPPYVPKGYAEELLACKVADTGVLTADSVSWSGVTEKPTAKDIGAAPAGYGLGGATTEPDDLNEATACGWYAFTAITANTPFNYGSLMVSNRYGNQITQVAFNPWMGSSGEICVRHFYNSKWYEWEYINPPMKIGVEYRTTERINSKVVYLKNIDGVINYRLEGETTWQPYAKAVGAALDLGNSTPKTYEVKTTSFINAGSIIAESLNGVLKVGGYFQTKTAHYAGSTDVICTISGVKVNGNTYSTVVDHDGTGKAYNVLLYTDGETTRVQMESAGYDMAAGMWINFSIIGLVGG